MNMWGEKLSSIITNPDLRASQGDKNGMGKRAGCEILMPLLLRTNKSDLGNLKGLPARLPELNLHN